MNPEKAVSQTLNIGKDKRDGSKIRRWIWVIFLIFVFLSGAYYWRSKSNGKEPQYKTQEVTRGDLTVTVTATGSLAPTSAVQVGSELSGIIKTITVDFNDQVKIGQPLVYLDDTLYQAAVMGARAALASANAKLAQALATVTQKQQNLKRLRQAGRLSEGKALSPYDLESAEAELERARADEASAQAAIQQAKANLMLDEANLAKTVIYSPVNGIVLERNVDPGQTMAASYQAPVLFILAEDPTQMELQVDVDEADVGQIRDGQDATFTVDAYPDRIFQARIVQVRYGSQTTNNVVTYKTLLKVDNPDLVLRPGMTATADIIVEKIKKAILVPNAALRYIPPAAGKPEQKRGLVGMLLPRFPVRGSKTSDTSDKETKSKVWILQQGQPAPVNVVTGATDGNNTVVVKGDLKPGTQLVVDTLTVAK
ncbi:MAG: efflux RND transporter periplasmic adaptor subunit [Desulfobacterium sp.]|nr:efflux RND transporter periplasmic adaptor subunit [Desulfobacterium sp.]